jgi:oligoribonuclease (3'-5' exoribonuclease)
MWLSRCAPITGIVIPLPRRDRSWLGHRRTPTVARLILYRGLEVSTLMELAPFADFGALHGLWPTG